MDFFQFKVRGFIKFIIKRLQNESVKQNCRYTKLYKTVARLVQ